jgi:chromosomal replication initiator protein
MNTPIPYIPLWNVIQMQAWSDFLKLLEIQLGAETVQRWLLPLKILRFDACNIYLEAKDSFHALWFEEHIQKKAATLLVNNSGNPIKVHLTTAQNKSIHDPIENQDAPGNAVKSSTPAPAAFSLNFQAIDPYATLEHFAPLPDALLPFKLLCHTSGCNPLTGQFDPNARPELGTFNPIYLYGSKGSGKTHLLMAVTGALRKHGIQALYVQATTFTEHVVAAIRAGQMSAFRQAYRTNDVLIIDDVHTFSGKAATQEELFHTFNTLHVANQQIILSANCSPADLNKIEPRLVSRFEWGIVLPMPHLGQSELRTILSKKMEILHFPLHTAVIEFLLNTFFDSKSLLQALEALILRSHMQRRAGTNISSTQITLSQAKYYLNDLIRTHAEQSLTPEKILDAVGQTFGIKRDDILGKSKNREYVLPRQMAMHLCRMQLKLPFKKIGDLFNKDHSTVMASVKLIQEGLDGNKEEICSAYHTLSRHLQQE